MKTTRSMRALGLAALLAPSASARAQLARGYLSGVHQYVVNGTFQGEQMAPWESELEVRDTTVNGEAAINVVHLTIRHDPPARFTYSTILKRATLSALTAKWLNGGREPNGCTLSVDRGRISGKVDAGEGVTPVDVKGAAVPDFAVGAALALRPLANGDTIRLTAFRCLPHWNAKAIVTKNLVAVVRSAEMSRSGGAAAEPVWVVEGLEPYRMMARIAKRDRQLLSFTIPEGSVGEQTQTFAKTRMK